MLSRCKAVEEYMLQRSFACPVYFIEEEKDVMNVYNTLKEKSTALTVLSFSSSKVATEHLYNQRELPS